MSDGFSTPRERTEAYPTFMAYCMAQNDDSLARLIWDANHQFNVFASYRGNSGEHAQTMIAAIAARATSGTGGGEKLWCESCGEAEQSVHTEFAGLCAQCADEQGEQ